MKTKIYLEALKQQAKVRPDGYYDDVTSKGVIVNDKYLLIEWDDYIKLGQKYNPSRKTYVKPPCNDCKGMGDVVAKVAQPIAKMIDKVAGTDIEHCGGCKKRRDKLNEILPFKKSA